MKEKEKEKELNKINTIKTVYTSNSTTKVNETTSFKNDDRFIHKFGNVQENLNYENYEYDDDVMYSQLFEKHQKEIINYEYSHIEAKLKEIYFFPVFIQNTSHPEVFAVRYDKSDAYLAGGYSTGHIVLFDTQNGNYIKHMSLSDYPVAMIRWKTSGTKPVLNAVHSDGKVSQWYANAGKLLYSFEEKDNFIMCMDYDVKGTVFATGGSDNQIRIYDDETKSIINTISSNVDYITHSNRIFSILFGKEKVYESLIISGGWDNTIKFSDVRSKKIVNSIYGPHIVGDSLDMKDHYLLTGSTDIKDQIKIWDLRTFEVVETVKFEPDQPENKFFVTNINCAQFGKYHDAFDTSKFYNTFACGGIKKNQLRIFSDSNKLINLRKLGELYTEYSYLSEDYIKKASSNQVNILKDDNKTIKPQEINTIRVPITKLDNLADCVYSLDYMNSSNTLAYGTGLGCIYSINIKNK